LFSTTNDVNVVTGVGDPTGFTTLNDEDIVILPQSQSVDVEPLLSSSFEQDIKNNAIVPNNSFFIFLIFRFINS
jgi:hypothetical protein